jgi:hypothetical protein
MPGYNHYAWCTCGWCFKTKSGAYATSRAPQRMPHLNSSAVLAQHRVSETRSVACFVNPNATCPVCGEPVYYYQNSNGSRVYFDDLGWPWPKHPCTNNSSARSGAVGTAKFPNEMRDRKTSETILSAAHEQSVVFKRTLESDGWLLGVVIKVTFFDGISEVFVSFLEEERPPAKFRCEITSPFLKPNSIIAYKGDIVSLPDASSLEPITINVHWVG